MNMLLLEKSMNKNLKKKNNCPGCENIKNQSFPFTKNKKGKPAIDTEGCGFYDEKDYSNLEINYCPVCRRKLK